MFIISNPFDLTGIHVYFHHALMDGHFLILFIKQLSCNICVKVTFPDKLFFFSFIKYGITADLTILLNFHSC
jgi:hypothetical protein